MLFNSLTFLVFLPVVFILYWLVLNRTLRLQNLLLVIASYIFYGWWDWRFLSLIVASSLIDFYTGRAIHRSGSDRARRRLLVLSLGFNLGILGIFKYFNFFIQSFADGIQSLGLNASVPVLHIVLPVGVSFYTFQTLSYTIDIYRERIKPTDNLIAFMAFVSFFPQLVAGPIERAGHLLPQFLEPRRICHESIRLGVQLTVWGLFKKVVVADRLGGYVDLVYESPESYGSSAIILATFFFAFQIYCDFSGYSDMAIGISRMFGFELMVNFRTPYFATSMQDFWSRWHISLSSWFRDYVYIPLGGNRVGEGRRLVNLFITFLVSGLWHGANWTFVVWGAIHGAMSSAESCLRISRPAVLNQLPKAVRWLLVFTVVCTAWVFFRAETVGQAFFILGKIAELDFSSSPKIIGSAEFTLCFASIAVLLAVEWIHGKSPVYQILPDSNPKLTWGIYTLMVTGIMLFGVFRSNQFIYFQF